MSYTMLKIRSNLAMELLLLYAGFAVVHANKNCHATDQDPPSLDSWFEELEVLDKMLLTCKIPRASENDTGNYTCVASTTKGTFLFNQTMHIEITESGEMTERKNETGLEATRFPSTLNCTVKEKSGYRKLIWQLEFDDGSVVLTNLRITAHVIESDATITLNVTRIVPNYDETIIPCDAIYSRVPEFQQINFIRFYRICAIGSNSIYVDWYLPYYHDYSLRVRLLYMKNGTGHWYFHTEVRSTHNAGRIVTGLESDTAYKFKLVVIKPSCDSRAAYSRWVKTLRKEMDSEDQETTGLDSTCPKIGSGANSTCEIHGANGNDSVNYACQAYASNSLFDLTTRLYVAIEPGETTAEAEGIHVKANKVASLSCAILRKCNYPSIVGLLELEYAAVDLTNLTIIVDYVEYTGTPWALHLTNIMQDDDANYRCLAHLFPKPGYRPYKIGNILSG